MMCPIPPTRSQYTFSVKRAEHSLCAADQFHICSTHFLDMSGHFLGIFWTTIIPFEKIPCLLHRRLQGKGPCCCTMAGTRGPESTPSRSCRRMWTPRAAPKSLPASEGRLGRHAVGAAGARLRGGGGAGRRGGRLRGADPSGARRHRPSRRRRGAAAARAAIWHRADRRGRRYPAHRTALGAHAHEPLGGRRRRSRARACGSIGACSARARRAPMRARAVGAMPGRYARAAVARAAGVGRATHVRRARAHSARAHIARARARADEAMPRRARAAVAREAGDSRAALARARARRPLHARDRACGQRASRRRARAVGARAHARAHGPQGTRAACRRSGGERGVRAQGAARRRSDSPAFGRICAQTLRKRAAPGSIGAQTTGCGHTMSCGPSRGHTMSTSWFCSHAYQRVAATPCLAASSRVVAPWSRRPLRLRSAR